MEAALKTLITREEKHDFASVVLLGTSYNVSQKHLSSKKF